MKGAKEVLQWHPAFYAALQVELGTEGQLAFINEYQLGTKPKEVDVLIIKKEDRGQLEKAIGRIFRKYNLVEYKSPRDYLSVDDFYKGLAYVCLYKSDTDRVNKVDIDEVTLTFAVSHYPREVLKYLAGKEGYTVEKRAAGIYYVLGSLVPIQIIVLSQLSAEENLWLKVLTNDLREKETARRMLTEYEKHRDNILYSSVMDIVVRANKEAFYEEENTMCEALEQIINEKLDAREERGKQEGREQGRQEGMKALLCSRKNTVCNLRKMNLSTEQIAFAVEESVETVEKWLAEI